MVLPDGVGDGSPAAEHAETMDKGSALLGIIVDEPHGAVCAARILHHRACQPLAGSPRANQEDLFGSPLPRPADAIAPEFPETPADAKERKPEEAEDIVENQHAPRDQVNRLRRAQDKDDSERGERPE